MSSPYLRRTKNDFSIWDFLHELYYNSGISGRGDDDPGVPAAVDKSNKEQIDAGYFAGDVYCHLHRDIPLAGLWFIDKFTPDNSGQCRYARDRRDDSNFKDQI